MVDLVNRYLFSCLMC